MTKYNPFNLRYWEERYSHGQTGWDIGYPSTPLITYFETQVEKNARILIPGAGNAHEALWLHQNGFKNVTILDIARQPLIYFKQNHPEFPQEQIIHGDFFTFHGEFDLIMEQTFFCAFHPDLRPDYVDKSIELLTERGLIMGVVWAQSMNSDSPPFGGDEEEYRALFKNSFEFLTLEKCYNSIPPRMNRELFMVAQRNHIKR